MFKTNMVGECRLGFYTYPLSSFHSLISFFHALLSRFTVFGLVIARWILSDYFTLPAMVWFMWYLFQKHYWWTLGMALLW